MKKFIIYWLPMIALGMGNGFFRGLVLNKYFDEMQARQLSTASLIVLLILYVWSIYDKLGIQSGRQAFNIGIIWAFLTFLFETLLGYFVSGLTLSAILSEYNIFEGRLWVLVLIVLTFLPVVFHTLKKR